MEPYFSATAAYEKSCQFDPKISDLSIFCGAFNAKIHRNAIHPVALINKGRNFPRIDYGERKNEEADLLSV